MGSLPTSYNRLYLSLKNIAPDDTVVGMIMFVEGTAVVYRLVDFDKQIG